MIGNLGLALFSAALYAISIPGYGVSAAYKSPACLGLIYGLIFGNVEQGLIVGCSIQLLYLGVVSTGNNMPADSYLAGIIAIPIALSQNMDAKMAVTIAVPFGVLGTFFNNIKRSFNIWLTHYADKKVDEGNFKEVNRCGFWYPYLFVSVS